MTVLNKLITIFTILNISLAHIKNMNSLIYTLQNLWETRRKTMIGIIALIVFILVGGLFVLLVPQNKRPTLQSVDPNIPLDKVEIVWWKPRFPQINSATYREVISQFEKQNPNVKIKIIDKTYGRDYYRELISAMARGEGPDIFSIYNNDLQAYLPYIIPIEAFQTVSPTSGKRHIELYKRDFVDIVVRDTIIQDQVYGVTSYVDNLQLYVNRDLLNQAGIALPARTWEDLLVQVPALTQRNQFNDTFERSAISLGTGSNVNNTLSNIDRHHEIIPLLIFQKGNPIYDFVNKKSVLGSNFEAALEAINFYYSFADFRSNNYTWNNKSPNNIEAFTSGRLAYLIHYSYLEPQIQQRNPRLNYEVVPIPQFNPNNKKTFGFFYMDVVNLQVAQNRAKKYWVDQLLLYLSQTEQQTNIAAKSGLPGARRDVINEQLKGDRKKQIFAEGALIADSYYRPDIEKTQEIWSQMLYEVHFEGKNTKDAFRQAINKYNAIIANGPKIR